MYRIQECKPKDAEQLSVLAEQTFRHSYAPLNDPVNLEHYVTKHLNATQLLTELKDPHCHYYWITADEEPVAYLKVNRPPAHTEPGYEQGLEIQRIYVQQVHQRQGLGRLLIQLAHTVASKQGLKYIWLGVWEKNPAAIQFYRNLGFYPVGSHNFMVGSELQLDHILRLDL